MSGRGEEEEEEEVEAADMAERREGADVAAVEETSGRAGGLSPKG